MGQFVKGPYFTQAIQIERRGEDLDILIKSGVRESIVFLKLL